MAKKQDHTKELFEIILSLKSNLDNCIQLIKKITNENNELNSSNINLTEKLSELEEEMKNYTKVSFVSNLSKQITEKDQQIVFLKKKVCKLESDLTNSQITNHTNEDLLVEINATKDNDSIKDDNALIDTRREEEDNDEENVVQDKQKDFNIDKIQEHEHREDKNNRDIDKQEDDNEENDIDEQEEDSDENDIDEQEDEALDRDEQEEDSDENDIDEQEDEDLDRDESGDEFSDEEEIEFEMKKIGKKNYYISNELPPGVYDIENDDIGKKLGNFINNKLVKSA